MKEQSRMKDIAEAAAKDWLTLFFAGLGITFAPHEWLGGMLLGLAGGGFARHIDPEQDKRELWIVFLGAFLTSHIAALAWEVWPQDWPGIPVPVQLVMLMAGFASRRLTRTVMRIFGLIEARSDTIADRLVDRALPAKDPKEPGQ